ncbi:crotonase/enoyl-CoA hydratase family protein [Nocardia sp. R6R-6]|uniref:crotonase/enoyl-CoA hydratase family protein n=1 Tax=Nocardia sp. R6R-6 TaxID=3459303 RepID=UPI00403D635E
MTGTEASESTPVRLSVTDAVATITIDRPHVRNAVDRTTAMAIEQALDEVDSRDDIRVCVVTGAGGIFSAGMDLKAFNESGERPIGTTRGGFGLVERPSVKPMIAAVEGKALGGGFEIALACDLVVAGSSAQFGLPEVKRGLVASAGGVLRLPQRVSRAVALGILFTGDPISADRAAELGLVNEVVADGAALAGALAWAERIAANAPLALRAVKQIADSSPDWASGESFTRQRPIADAVRASQDAAEGAQAFVQKRVPVWQGR